MENDKTVIFKCDILGDVSMKDFFLIRILFVHFIFRLFTFVDSWKSRYE